MVTIIIFAVLGLGVGVYYVWGDYSIYDTLLESIVIGLLLGALLSLSGLLIGIGISYALPQKNIRATEIYKLEALQDNNGIHGYFFIGCGNIDNKMQYVYYYEKNGSYYNDAIETKGVEIKYVDSNYRIEKYYDKAVEKAFINYFALDGENPTYILFIPKGSIKNNYALDAQ